MSGPIAHSSPLCLSVSDVADVSKITRLNDLSLEDQVKESEDLKTLPASRFKLRDNFTFFWLKYKDRHKPESDCEEVSPQEPLKWTHIPTSRLGLIDSQQKSAFKFKLENHRRTLKTHNFYYKWILWTENHHAEISIDRIIENTVDLKETKKMLKYSEDKKLHIFKIGYKPKKKYFAEGQRIHFKVTRPLYDFKKDLLRVVLSDTLYDPFSLQISISGITFKPAHEGDEDIVSLWLDHKHDRRAIVGLLDAVSPHITEYVRDALQTAFVTDVDVKEVWEVCPENDTVISS